ncbi:MAG: TIGR02687 family protein [Anaerolineaceae bacterium]|nr:TIGR02687 family protein [Anaerolineaceae bacterium]
METQIKTALERLFEKHRIVFWYDTKQEFSSVIHEMRLPGIEVLPVENNQYAVNYRVLREEPKQKFLLYMAQAEPPDAENWLLGLQLANAVFRTDQESLWLSDLGLGPEYRFIITPHTEFFKAEKRREALKAYQPQNLTPKELQLTLLAICVNAQPDLASILLSLISESAQDSTEKYSLVQRCGLESFLWAEAASLYQYQSENPGVIDFVFALLRYAYFGVVEKYAPLNQNALVFLKHWQDSNRYAADFRTLSFQAAQVLGIEGDLSQRDLEFCLPLDTFSLIDQKVLSDLVKGVLNRTVSLERVHAVIRERSSRFWFADYQSDYLAVKNAASFLLSLPNLSFFASSMPDGIQKYSQTWYELDQFYRRFITEMRKSGRTTFYEPLFKQVELYYQNQYLLPLNTAWQEAIDHSETWDAAPILRQDRFYAEKVAPFADNKTHVVVIISDALRYEVGKELRDRLLALNRFEARLSVMLSMLPSYTQLGMAALLPNQELAVIPGGLQVSVDGLPAQGTENRQKILMNAVGERAKAVRWEDLKLLNAESSRKLFSDHDVLYVYHNHIDQTGDKRESEERTFEAVETTLDEVIQIVRKLASANATHFLITSDHGFLFQLGELQESDFSPISPSGEAVWGINRRFVVGKGLDNQEGLTTFTAQALNLAGDTVFQFPKAVNRLRVKGAGARYVHGGISLQEVVLPVIEVQKKRIDTVRSVDVDVMMGTSKRVITSGQVAVSFYQSEAVTPTCLGRKLRVGFYSLDGVLLSNAEELWFNAESENKRDWEQTVRFLLSHQANDYNGQEIELRLEERAGETSHYALYTSVAYRLQRSFTSDFDF